MANKKRLEPTNPDNIVTTWVQAELSQGKTIKEAMEGLNDHVGTHYAPDRAYMWERGRSLPGREVFNYMLFRTIPIVLSEYKLKKSVVEKLSNKLTMPKLLNE